ncbi:ABC transporter permease [Acetobacterium sp. K1/6]|jgi:putative ABC transport system permease protein|uniref:ABC transporter permease n=1 Tax=Acetobacterium sp. K1/6 TaxID=3055467 RepID=UPI002ACAFCDC|nr:ABC transporter permease [Acetobacterium sp. K1/6]MDZ5724406.1 ABC transporter permease [Acetobacterium sp. K1/6]
MNIRMIATNNIKKAKVATATLIILIAIAAILLYVGISVLSNLGTFIDVKNTQNNGAHFVSITDGTNDQEIQAIYEASETYDYGEREPGIMSLASKFQDVSIGEKAYSISSLFLNLDTSRKISQVDLIDEAAVMPENGVVVPYILKVANGYKTGDILKFMVDDASIDLEIAGFYEDLMFASPSNVSMYKLFVGDQQFNELIAQPEFGLTVSYSAVILDDINDAEAFESQYIEKTRTLIPDGNGNFSLVYGSMKIGVAIFINIIMAVLLSFSLIILAIAAIVIKFSTITHIENNIKNIGTLEAMGYTTHQIICATLLEYLIISIVGFIVGLGASFFISPVITNVVSSSIGLSWTMGIYPVAVIVSLGMVMILVLGIAYFSAFKIKRITPLTALRNGVQTHHFEKNRIPLEQTKLSLNPAMGLKMLIQNKRQNLIAGVIIMLLSLVTVFSLAAYYNFSVDQTAMIKLIGLETADVQVSVSDNEAEIFAEIEEMQGVDEVIKLTFFESIIKYEGKESGANTRITEDYERLKVDTCVKGRMPVNDNEIAITSIVLNSIGAKMGDTVSIDYNGLTREYLVVGIIQQFNMLGKGAAITTAGMKKLVPSFEEKNLMIYLGDGLDTEKFVTKLNNQYMDQNIQSVSYFESIEMMLNSFEASVQIVVVGCLGVIAVIIVFILFLVVRVRLLRERTRLGVSKALGFTSSQLIGQILISEMPVIIGASMVGAVAGYFTTNPLLALMLSANGILNCDFYVDPSMVLLTPIGISLIGLATVLIVSGKIRKISPCKMFEETTD